VTDSQGPNSPDRYIGMYDDEQLLIDGYLNKDPDGTRVRWEDYEALEKRLADENDPSTDGYQGLLQRLRQELEETKADALAEGKSKLRERHDRIMQERATEQLSAEVIRLDKLTCTPAERAVLDAMARLTDDELNSLSRAGNNEQDIASAELARRQGKTCGDPLCDFEDCGVSGTGKT
jgi:hypothetical protein